ncbi:DUF3310 domain-containing protein [Anaerostipes hominis (ex Lee et al. 2021)]|uniref:DUF3310 domain-containing protein n=1 Tax=Anaerostipes hominis (ex Lee et al. 2021) TaxID=2025494 RepID=UPI0022E9413E|nr:DUF3310 domain-containing protein [Anaerostipes hominis (ex Lee et al. 2021)]
MTKMRLIRIITWTVELTRLILLKQKDLIFCLGNAVKYISRAGKKDPEKYKEDLQKAMWYLDREIKKYE